MAASVTLTVSASQQVSATYTLEQPVQTLRLSAREADVRRESWTVLTPGIRLVDGTTLVTETDTGFRHVDILGAPLQAKIDRQYEPVVQFSDGGSAVFTRIFNLAPDEPTLDFLLTPSPGGRVILTGSDSTTPVFRSAGAFDDAGTYVYFGETNPVQTTGSTLLIDAGLPTWITQEFSATFPRIMNELRRQFAQTPGRKPLVLLTRDPRPGDGFAGEVLPGVIRISFAGTQWSEPDAESVRSAIALLAHESVHLWNGNADSEAAPWMHEGAAELLSWSALLTLDIVDDDWVLDRLNNALNQCSTLLHSVGPAALAGGPGPYSCGTVAALLSDVALKANQRTLFDLWAVLASVNRYRTEHYFSALTQLAADPAIVAELSSIREGDASSPGQWQRALDRLGVELTVEESTDIPAWLFRRQLADIMTTDCGGFGFNDSGDRIKVLATGCDTLNGEPVIHRIGRMTLDRRDEIYQRMRDQCGKQHAIEFEVTTSPSPRPQRLNVLCEPPPPALDIRLTTLP